METDVQVSMYNLVISMSARNNDTMNEDEAMLYHQCCNTLKAQAELDELVVRNSLEKLKNPTDHRDDNEQPEHLPC